MTTAHDQTVYFDELADLFERFAADTDCIYRVWAQAAVPRRGGRAVDLGCGSGRFVSMLSGRYDQVLAVDISAREIEMARVRHPYPNVDYEVRSLLDVTPERDGLFDLVFSVNSIHHLRDHVRVLPHVRSLVAPGGHAVLIDIVDPGQWGSRDWHVSEAFRDAEESYRRRSRTPEAAADVLRLRLHPAWLEHVTTSIPLTRDDFHAVYGEVFPGAEFTDDLNHVVAAVCWQAPEQVSA
jgi:SAM-dependent methyltransferase